MSTEPRNSSLQLYSKELCSVHILTTEPRIMLIGEVKDIELGQHGTS